MRDREKWLIYKRFWLWFHSYGSREERVRLRKLVEALERRRRRLEP